MTEASTIKTVGKLTGTGLTVLALSIAQAFAQTAETPAAPGQSAEAPAPVAAAADTAQAQKIVVTGSRLANRGYAAPSPTVVMDAQELKLSGAQTLETALVESPQFLGNTYNAAGNGGSMGVAALNMRGLGEQRNLILVNGRRYTVTGTDSLTDLNTIPSALVKRIDVVTGGSSAVYGSDAISGVVNFIMRNDFKGVEVTAETKRDQHTNTPANVATLTMGGNFDDNKGNAVVSLDYYNRGGIQRGQYGWAALGLADGCVTAASFSDRGPGVPLAVPSGQTCTGAGGRAGFVAANSASIPAGRITGIPLYGSAQSSPGLNAALAAAGLQNMTGFGATFDAGSNAARTALDPADRYNNTPVNYMQTPLRRVMANSFVNYRLDDSTTVYIESHFSNNLSTTAIAPGGMSNTVLVNTNNPYLSAADQEVLRQVDLLEKGTTTIKQGTQSYATTPGDGLAVIGINRRVLETGPRQSVLERSVMRTLLGVKGDTFADFSYDLYYSYARTTTTENQAGNFSLSRWQNAMLAVGGAAPVLNPFGPNSMSPAAVQAVTVSSTNVTQNEQQVAAGNLTGSLFSLSAGPVDFNTGFEWRNNKLSLVPDALNAMGDVSGQGIILPVAGKTTVKEWYGEVRVPLLKDAPFAKQLALNGAARYSKYNLKGADGVWTHSVGLQWQPVSDISVRTQLQKAIRAPNIGELYSPRTPLTPVVNDPCSSRVAAAGQTAALRALCAATGVPAAAVFTSGVQPNSQIATLNGGNADLSPETANTTTLGLIYTPRAIPNLALSVDLYRIKLDGAIAAFGGNLQNVFDLCYNVFANANSVYCKAIHRDPITGGLTGGNFYVDQFLSNTGGIKTSGADLNGQYGLNLPYAPFGGTSRIDVTSNWSYTRDYTFTPVQDLPNLKNYCAGSFGTICGAPAPKWKGVTRVTWRTGPLTLSLHDRYTGEVTRDTYLVPLRQGLVPTSLDNISAAKIKAQQYFDLSFALALPRQTEVYGGINNLTAKEPPLLGSGATTWGLGTAPGVYELYGRSFFLGLKKQL